MLFFFIFVFREEVFEEDEEIGGEEESKNRETKKTRLLPTLHPHLAAFPVLPEREAPSGVEHRAAVHSLAPALPIATAATPCSGALVGVKVVLVVLALAHRDDPDCEPRLAAAAAGAAPASRS